VQSGGLSARRSGQWGETFARCDEKGCDEYPALFTRSGLFTNIVFAPGTLAKLSDTGSLVEVVTLGMVALVSYGRCF
jgi:hypothetical protein